MKKIIASLMIAVMLAVSCFSVIGTASAGSIFDTIGSLAKSAVHIVKAGCNGVKGIALDVFTDTPSDECYKDMHASYDKAVEHADNIIKNGEKVLDDFVDLAVGSKDVVVGAFGAAGTALYETEEWIRTGKKDYSRSEAFVDTMKEGYKKADNGIFTDVAVIASSAFGVPAYFVAGAQLVKSGTELAVGYKDGGEAAKEMVAAGFSGVTCGLCKGFDVTGMANTAINYAVNTTVKITTDIIDNKDNRSMLDIVLEDTVESAAKTAALTGIGKAGEAIRAHNAANNNADAASDNASNAAVDNASVDNVSDNTSVSSGSTADTVSSGSTADTMSSGGSDISFDSGVDVPIENEI